MTQALSSDPPDLNFWERNKRPLFIAALFVVIFISARFAIRPINNTDYNSYILGLQLFWRGESPYNSVNYYMPPWSAFFLAPLVNQPLETWLALNVALFATAIIDLGKPSGLLLLIHPVFITLLAASNPEWLLIGPGLWLLYRAPKGWRRGLAWLLLTCKPQTSAILLLFDGWDALRERDWKAIGLSAVVAAATLALYPQWFRRLTIPFDWSASVLSHYGILGALIVTAIVLALRRNRLQDQKTVGLILGPVWSLYMLQYSYTGMAFTMRGAGWLRTVVYVAGCIGLALLFWRDFHVSEQIGMLGMLLLTAILAPAYFPENATPLETK
jgi:hypothetical protein